MRDERTNNATFRAALRDLTLMLVYEATREAPPKASRSAHRSPTPPDPDSHNPPLLVPVLRAGLGMVDQATC